MEAFTVKTFGMLAEKLDRKELELPYCSNTVELRENLFHKYPELKGYNFSLAVDRKLVQGTAPLNGSEEIALLPPFSGG